MTFLAWKRLPHSRTVWFSLFVMVAFGLVAVLAPWIAPHDPFRWEIDRSNLPPMWVQDRPHPGVAAYPLGTDRFGRDILSRLIYGTRTAFLLALTAVPLAALIGTLVGLWAGYAGGRVDAGVVLLTDIIHALPGIMFLVLIVLIFRELLSAIWFHGLLTLVVGFAAVAWVSLARLIRVSVLEVKSRLFVEAAISIGASPRRVIMRHLLPNVLHVILVWVINNIPAVILLEALLGYIGLGVTGATDGSEFTATSWGGLFFAGRSALRSNPIILLAPSLCLLLLSMSFILLADHLDGASRPERG